MDLNVLCTFYTSVILVCYFSCEANSLELWLTHCWPSIHAAITSTNRFHLLQLIDIIWFVIFNYNALSF